MTSDSGLVWQGSGSSKNGSGSGSSEGAEAVLENVWQNGSFALDDVNPQQGAARSSFLRLLLRRQKMTPALDQLCMRSPFQNSHLVQLLQEPELKEALRAYHRAFSIVLGVLMGFVLGVLIGLFYASFEM